MTNFSVAVKKSNDFDATINNWEKAVLVQTTLSLTLTYIFKDWIATGLRKTPFYTNEFLPLSKEFTFVFVVEMLTNVLMDKKRFIQVK